MRGRKEEIQEKKSWSFFFLEVITSTARLPKGTRKRFFTLTHSTRLLPHQEVAAPETQFHRITIEHAYVELFSSHNSYALYQGVTLYYFTFYSHCWGKNESRLTVNCFSVWNCSCGIFALMIITIPLLPHLAFLPFIHRSWLLRKAPLFLCINRPCKVINCRSTLFTAFVKSDSNY